jgi:hypothetical protein
VFGEKFLTYLGNFEGVAVSVLFVALCLSGEELENPDGSKFGLLWGVAILRLVGGSIFIKDLVCGWLKLIGS